MDPEKSNILKMPLSGSGTAIIPCLAGQRIRLAAFNVVMTPFAAFERYVMTIVYDNTAVGFITSPDNCAAETVWSGFLGVNSPPPSPTNVDQVTGAVTYLANPLTSALPDIWFDRPITIAFSGHAGGTFSSGNIIYEVINQR